MVTVGVVGGSDLIKISEQLGKTGIVIFLFSFNEVVMSIVCENLPHFDG